jgi:dTDP-4-amino-4,6-dideoxygalactose transaminase
MEQEQEEACYSEVIMKRTFKPVRSKDRFLVFGQPCIEQAEVEEVADSLHKRWLGTGPKVAQFEDTMAQYKGVSHAIAVSSCTSGLHLACLVLGLGPGDEVVTTALTFCATVNVVIHCGATPVLADVDPVSMNIDPQSVAEKVTERTRAIIVVHLAGRPCDMAAIMAIAEEHGLLVIEDCAHAIETEYHGQKAGTIGSVGVLSFYATKNLTTGEGGMVLTNSAELADRIKQLSLHGLSADAWRRYSDSGYKHYYAVEAGYKYNMMDLQAAIGLHQFERLAGYARRRQQIWEMYLQAFASTPLVLPSSEEPDTRHARHLFTVLVDQERCGITRDEFLSRMTEHNIGVGVHYLSIPEHPYYQQTYGWLPEAWPNAMRIGRQTVSLPLSGCLTGGDVQDVIDAVYDVLA